MAQKDLQVLKCDRIVVDIEGGRTWLIILSNCVYHGIISFRLPSILLLRQSLGWQQVLAPQVLNNLHNRLLHTGLNTLDHNLGILWCLIRRRDTSELLDLTSSSLLVEPLWIALLCLLDRDLDVDLDEWDWLVALWNGGVELAGDLAVGLVWGDEGGEGCGCGVGEEPCYLSMFR